MKPPPVFLSQSCFARRKFRFRLSEQSQCIHVRGNASQRHPPLKHLLRPRNALRMPEVLAMGADKKFIVNLSSRISEACRLMH